MNILLGILLTTCRYFKTNFKVKNFFSLDTFLKVSFIYICSLIFSFLHFINFSDNLLSNHLSGKKTSPVILIVNSSTHLGESMVCERLKKTLPKMGYGFITVEYLLDMQNIFFLRHFIQMSANLASLVFKPEFNLSLSHYLYVKPLGFNAVYLNVPRGLLFASNLKFHKMYQHLYDYDAYLDIYTYVNNTDNTILKNEIGNKPILTGYIANNFTEFQELPSNYALISGSLWGCGRSSFKFLLTLKKLAENGLLRAQGDQVFSALGAAYDNLLETDKSYDAEEELKQSIQKAGIYLIVHNNEHSNERIPTSRISEAVANSVLAISDLHPFIIEHFGDSVFYFDMNADETTIHNTIRDHIQFARKNPEKVLAMKRKAHKIFAEKFTMEIQLESIIKQIHKAKKESQITP